jgi:hypothetical protein
MRVRRSGEKGAEIAPGPMLSPVGLPFRHTGRIFTGETFAKVVNGRKPPIHGRRRRNGRFEAN